MVLGFFLGRVEISDGYIFMWLMSMVDFPYSR